MKNKERIDVLLVEKGFFETRERAKRAVMAGTVYIDVNRVDKPGTKIDITSEIIVKGSTLKYVGRGGLKLEHALDYFQIDLTNVTAIDIGASTGGFTDCMLQNEAKKVYAVDVGYNQLAWKIRSDERVIVKERTNFRYVDPSDFAGDRPSFASIDVSFISLRHMLPILKKIMKQNGLIVALVKPQFEAGKNEVGKKGIVRDAEIHLRVLDEMIAFALKQGFSVKDLTYSPITGAQGNIEYLLFLEWSEKGEFQLRSNPKDIVNAAHQQL